MKKIKNQVLAYVLIVALTISNLFLVNIYNVYADTYSGNAGDNIYWSIDTENGFMNVTGNGNMASYSEWQWTPYSVSYRDYVIKANVQEGITSIGNNAFCCFEKLEEVSIPLSATTIGYYAFNNCFVIESISAPEVTFIDSHAFYQCYLLKNVELGENLSRINKYVFGRCSSLEHLYLPKSLTTIEKYAFSECDSLTDIYYGGSEEDWEQISIDYGNDDLLNANIHFNSTYEDSKEPQEEIPTEQPSEEVTTIGEKGSLKFFPDSKISRYVGQTTGILLILDSIEYNIGDLKFESSDTNIAKIGTVSIGEGSYITQGNEKIATLYLELKSEGIVNITAITPDGSSAICEINVVGEETTKEDIDESNYGYQWSIQNMSLSIHPQYFTAIYGKYQGAKLYEKNKDAGKSGMCYGFTLSSAVLESGSIKVNDLFYEDKLFDVKNLYETAKSNFIIHQPIDLIIYSHLYQLSYDVSSQSKKNHSIKNLIKELSEGNTNILVYVENKAHAVIAKNIRQISETSWIIDVYDSNWPGELNKIYITKQNNDYGYLFDSWNGHEHEGNSGEFFGTSDLTYMHVSDNYIKTLISGKTIDKIDNFCQFLLTANVDIENKCNKELYKVTGYTEGENEISDNRVYWVNGNDKDIAISNITEISLTGIDSDYEVLLSDGSDIVFKTNEEEIDSVVLEENIEASIIIKKEIDGKEVSFEIQGKTGEGATVISQENGMKINNFDGTTTIEVSSDGNILGKQEIDTKNIEISVDGENLEINKNEDIETTKTEEKTTEKIEETSDNTTTISNTDASQPSVIVKEEKTTGKLSTTIENKKSTKIKKVKVKKKSLKITWKKIKGVSGYQIQYSTSSKFKKAKKVTIKKAKITSKTIKKLKAKKKYYVRIRTYVVINGTKKYSDWSKKKSKKIK